MNPLPAQLVIQPETISGVVVMCGNGALVGMELLRLFDKYLLVGPMVLLLDAAAVTAAAAAPSATPSKQTPP
jgi:hypothetical protein